MKNDNFNRLITLLQADPDGAGSLAKPEWHTVYDAVGNVVARIDPVGRLTKYDYDQLDRVVAMRQVDGAWPAAIVATTTQGGTANEVQRFGYSGAYGGSFTLSYSGQTTSTIAYNASAATVLAPWPLTAQVAHAQRISQPANSQPAAPRFARPAAWELFLPIPSAHEQPGQQSGTCWRNKEHDNEGAFLPCGSPSGCAPHIHVYPLTRAR